MKILKAILLFSIVSRLILEAQAEGPDARWTAQHASGVKGCAISADSKRIAAGTAEGKVIIYDAATGEVVKEIDAHSDVVNQIAFSPDGVLVASTSNDKTLKVWKVADGAAVRTFTHSAFLYPVVFGMDSKVVFTAGGGGFIRSWNVETGATVRTFAGESGSIWGLDLSTDGTRLVSASGAPNFRVRLWNAPAGSSIRSMTGHTADVRAAQFSPSGASIVTASADKTVKIWETETGRSRTLREATNELFSAAFSPDSQYVVAGSGAPENQLRFWRSSGDFGVAKAYNEGVARVNTVRFSKGGTSYVFCTESGDVTYARNPFASALMIGAATVSEAGMNFFWSGGGGPFQVETRTSLDSPWENFGAPTSTSSVTLPMTTESVFVRVQGVE